VSAERSFGISDAQTNGHLRITGKKAKAAFSRKPREHILIIDDEKRMVQNGREVLENLGYRVTSHTSSREALEMVRRQPKKFDLVITDFIMPQMNGIELAQELSQLRPDMPIILYTAISKAVSAEKAKLLGIKDYLLKPVTAGELGRAIRRVLDSR
jgi:two-component system cell cycle sensor histidine kinase/response regulator CckA